MNKFFSNAKAVANRVVKAVVIGGTATAGIANAAMDTTSITTALTDAGAAAAIVGGAVLVVIVGIKAFKYVRSAM